MARRRTKKKVREWYHRAASRTRNDEGARCTTGALENR
jgi:hypothetical protein